MTSPPPLQLRCRDLALHEDLCIDLGIPPGAFRFHDWDDLDPDDPCDCAAEIRMPVDEGLWDAQGRHDHNSRLAERNRRCRERTALQGAGFVLVICCRCRYNAGAGDVTLIKAGLAIAERERLDRAAERERAEVPDPDVFDELADTYDRLAAELEASTILIDKGHYSPKAVAAAGRALHKETE